MKWRDYDPQQYYNWRAYLDFGGGQVTDLFTHWIDVVHMFMGQDDSAVRLGRRRRLSTTRTGARLPTRSTCCWSIPREYTATFEATLAPGITGAAVEICGTKGRLYIDRRHYEFYPLGQRRAARGGEGRAARSDAGSREQLPGVRPDRASCPTATC